MKSTLPVCVAAALVFSVCGCHVGYYHSQTKWNEDGSVERTILQPGIDSQFAEEWGWSRSTSEKSMSFSGDIRKVKTVKDGIYSIASSKVDSWKELPGHYVSEDPEFDFKSTFQRDAKKTDHGLVVEYVWQETLTDVVEAGDARKAIQEGADLTGQYLQFVYEKALGEGYDASRLNQWIVTEGSEWAIEFFDVLYEASLRGVILYDGGARERLARVCHDHGLNVTMKETDQKQDEVELRRFLKQLCQKTIRKSNGDEIDDALAEAICGAIFNNSSRNVPGIKRVERKAESASTEFERSWPGGPDALKSTVQKLLVRIFAIHGRPLFGSEEFRFVMTVPGEIVETNGRLLEADRVQWTFSGRQAWPSGYTMSVRSLAPDRKLLKLLAGDSFQPTRKKLTWLIDFLAEDKPLLAAIQKCRKRGSTRPLKDYREQVSGQGEPLARLLVLLKLLESPLASGK